MAFEHLAFGIWHLSICHLLFAIRHLAFGIGKFAISFGLVGWISLCSHMAGDGDCNGRAPRNTSRFGSWSCLTPAASGPSTTAVCSTLPRFLNRCVFRPAKLNRKQKIYICDKHFLGFTQLACQCQCQCLRDYVNIKVNAKTHMVVCVLSIRIHLFISRAGQVVLEHLCI